MTERCFRFGMLVLLSVQLLFFAASGFAQIGAEEDAEDSAAQDEQEGSSDDGATADADIPDLDSGPLEEVDQNNDNQDGTGRFIPSEQISQDLGVSFPADI